MPATRSSGLPVPRVSTRTAAEGCPRSSPRGQAFNRKLIAHHAVRSADEILGFRTSYKSPDRRSSTTSRVFRLQADAGAKPLIGGLQIEPTYHGLLQRGVKLTELLPADWSAAQKVQTYAIPNCVRNRLEFCSVELWVTIPVNIRRLSWPHCRKKSLLTMACEKRSKLTILESGLLFAEVNWSEPMRPLKMLLTLPCNGLVQAHI